MAPCVGVACSGGRDSVALLVATAHAAAPLGVAVVALHVHHGLSAQADGWLAHCERLCQGLGVGLAWRRLSGRPGRGESVEAWARKGRYEALREMAVEQGASLVLLAHHRRDQAETWLLQGLRGAGPAGLAAMPSQAVREGLTWARPWLAQPRGAVEAYAREQALAHVDDDSNTDTRFARNRLRLQVWPALLQAFPDAEASLGQAARRAQAVRLCLDEVAQLDLAACADAAGLQLERWKALPPGRRDNALRSWLRKATGHAATQTLVDRLQAELASARPARWPVEGGELRAYRAVLRFRALAAPRAQPPQAAPAPAAAATPAAPVASAAPESTLRIARAGRYKLPGWGGVLVAVRVSEQGVAMARLASLTLRTRLGGESFQRSPAGAERALKKHYQAMHIAPWDRDGPLLFDVAGALLFVPGLGIDARAWAERGEAQLSLHWESDAAAG